jgi:protease
LNNDSSQRTLELLAPAKNLTCGIAAVDHGADAVYIGAERFGARSAAGNSVEDIGRLCAYAHPFGVKVYVTVNTIVYEDELEATQNLIWDLYRVGVDAILVAGYGFAETSTSTHRPARKYPNRQPNGRKGKLAYSAGI